MGFGGGYGGPAAIQIPADSILVLGDSISVQIFGGTYPTIPVLPSPDYAEKIKVAHAPHFPTAFDGAVAGTTSTDGLTIIDELLAGNPDPSVVVLAYGTNDAGHGDGTPQFQSSMTTLINKVKAAGKTPIVPTIPYAGAEPWHSAIPPYNTVVTGALWGISGVRHGPDLYAYFQAHSGELYSDGVHLSQTGLQSALDLWVAAMSWLYS